MLSLNQRRQFALLSLCLLALTSTAAHSQMCPFDDGNSTLTREGLILTRFALGLTGAALVANTDILAADAPTVEATILCPSCGLDINGNGGFDVVDATIISRKLAGYSGAALTTGLALGAGSRNTPAAVQSFLLAGCGATGGTVTSVTAGTGLTGGAITTAGTIAADTTFLQRRVGASCPVGSSIRVIATDGTVTCQADNVGGGGGTVTSVIAGIGLIGGTITTIGTITADPTYLQRRVSTTCAAGSSIRAIALDGSVTCETFPPAPTNTWIQGGNAFAVPGVIGTTDAQSLAVNSGGSSLALNVGSEGGLRLLRTSVVSVPNSTTVVGGSSFNVATGAGATIAGGGSSHATSCAPNADCANFAAGTGSAVGGGFANFASGYSTTVAGGNGNQALNSYDVVSGGRDNRASGANSTVVGGFGNEAAAAGSIAMGFRAKARNQGQLAHGIDKLNLPINPQYSRMVIATRTTDATPKEMTSTPVGLSTAGRLRFFAKQSGFIDATIFAKHASTSESSTWIVKCNVMVDATGVVTTVPTVCPATLIPSRATAGAGGWAVTVDSLTVLADGVVRFMVSGMAGDTVDWVASVQVTELMQ